MRGASPFLALLLVAALPAPGAHGEPLPPSRSADPDLKLGSTCRGDPSAKAVREALPERISELVVLWPRAGKTKADPCRTVGRLAVVDHRGLIITLSFVFAPAGPTGFHRWYPREGEEPESPRTGPPRNEYVWVPREGVPLHVVLAGSPSTSEENLEGATSFLEHEDALEPLIQLAQ